MITIPNRSLDELQNDLAYKFTLEAINQELMKNFETQSIAPQETTYPRLFKGSTYQFAVLFGIIDNIKLKNKRKKEITATHQNYVRKYYVSNEAPFLNNLGNQNAAGVIFMRLHQDENYPTGEGYREYIELKGFEENLIQEKIISNIKLFTNKRILIVYTKEKITLKCLIRLKCIEWSLLGYNYTTDENLIQEITDIYKTFKDENIVEINKILNKIFDIKQYKLKLIEQCKDLFKTNTQTIINDLTDTITGKENDAKYYEDLLCRLINEVERLKQQLLIVMTQPDEINFDEIKDYLMKHPFIQTIRKNGQIINIDITAPIKYYDKKLYDLTTKSYSDEDKRNIGYIISDRYELWTSACITFDPKTFTVHGGSSALNKYLPHPHIAEYNCLGNHPEVIKEWIKTRNYIGCFEQITAAVLNLNFSDATVINRLRIKLKNYSYEKIFFDKEKNIFVSLDDIKEEENGKA